MRFLTKKLFVGLVLIAAVVFVVIACRRAAAPAQAPTPISPPVSVAATPVATAAVETAPVQAPAGGRLVIGKIADVCYMDVHQGGCEASWQIDSMVFDSLVYQNQETLEFEPILVESWTTSDNRTYAFKLREGVQFHQQNDKGTRFSAAREMNASDAELSLKRLVDPNTGSSWGARLVGLKPEFKATGPLEMTITLEKPSLMLLPALSGMAAAILPGQETVDGTIDPNVEKIGAGPFYVVEHQQDHRWRLKKFEDYWQRQLLGRDVPLLDEVDWPIIPDDSTRLAALRTGEIDMTFFENPKMLDLLKNDPNITTVAQATTNYYRLDVQMSHGALQAPQVRQALSMATNRAELSQVAAFGYAQPATMVGAHRGGLSLQQAPFYEYDVAGAKKLLAEAGYPDGVKIGGMWVTPYIPLTVSIGEVLKKQWAQAGIEVDIVQLEQAKWIADLFAGNYDVLVSWSAGYADPAMILTGYNENNLKARYGYQDPTAFLQELATVVDETDPNLRQQRIRELEEAFANEAFHQALITKNTLIAYRKDVVGNMKLDNVDGWGVPLWKSILQITSSR
jgi:peptide/nickel transport system substrate-binding protein